MKFINKNTTNYLFRLRDAHKVNDECNGRLISGRLQEHVMNILYPFHVTAFDSLLDDDKKEGET